MCLRYYIGIHLPSGWYLRVCLIPIAWITSGVKNAFIWLLGPLITLLSLLMVVFILQNVKNGYLLDLGSNTTEATPYLNKRLPFTHDLPRLRGPFIGRDKLISNITQWLHQDSVMIVAIFGPPAIGKSSLGIHIGHIMLNKNYFVRYIDTSEHILFNERFSKSTDQQSHVNMHSLQIAIVQTWKFMLQVYDTTKGILIPSSDLEGTVNLGSNARTTKWPMLRKWARSVVNKTLLLLDNCDSILNDDREDFLGLLEDMIKLSNFNLKILLTSQVEIKLVDNFIPVHLEGLHPNDSVKLLNELVQGYGAHFEGQDAERIAELVENFPLALKVIGSVLQKSDQSSARLVQVLEHELLKTVSDRDRDKDNFTAIMDIAYSYLSSEIQNCSHYLSLLIHSFDKNAARKILNACYVECADCCIDTLVRHSLIEEFWYGYETRLKLYRLIQEYFLLKSPIKDLQTTKDCFKDSYFKYYSGLFMYLATLWSTGKLSEQQGHKFHSESHNMDFLMKMYEGAGFLTSMSEQTDERSKVLVGVAFVFSLAPTRTLSSRLMFEFNCGFHDIYEQIGAQTTITIYLQLIHYHCQESEYCCDFWIHYEEHYYKYRMILEAAAVGNLSMFAKQNEFLSLNQLLYTLKEHYNSCFGATTGFSIVFILAALILPFCSILGRYDNQYVFNVCTPFIVAMIVTVIVWSFEAGGCDQEIACLSPTNCYTYSAPQLNAFYKTIGFLFGLFTFFTSCVFVATVL